MNFEEEYKKLEEEGRLKFVTFHPTFSYEEFVEGYRPKKDGSFELEDGVFKEICMKAFYDLCETAGIPVESDDENDDKIKKTWKKFFGKEKDGLGKEDIEKIQVIKNNRVNKYVLIIDEINRGNISKIFGELITLLEPDKRIGDKQIIVTLPYSKEKFGVPPNLYIIGTMNTADRSIALVDIALRRRFGFVEMMPITNNEEFYGIIEDASSIPPGNEKITKDDIKNGLENLEIPELLKAMNERITFLADKEKQIGHAYFLNIFRDENGDYVKNPELWKQNLHRIWYHEITPLLEEYFYNDYEKIKTVLGRAGDKDKFIYEITNPFKGDDELGEVKRYKIKNYSPQELIGILKSIKPIYNKSSETGEHANE